MDGSPTGDQGVEMKVWKAIGQVVLIGNPAAMLDGFSDYHTRRGVDIDGAAGHPDGPLGQSAEKTIEFVGKKWILSGVLMEFPHELGGEVRTD